MAAGFLGIIGLVMIIGGTVEMSKLGVLAGAALIVFGALAIVIGVILTFLSMYRRTSADQAFVRTGLGGSRVVLDGGMTVMPFFHNILEINLRTMKLGVNPRGANALITKDNLRANVLAQFYIRVQADTEHILNAARSLGENSVNADAVEALVSEKLVSALRAIASQMDLFEIHTKRDTFAERVKEHVKSDLEANGLLLESVTISELDQTDPKELSDSNVFDAQGKKKITEITAAAAVERNMLERQAEQAKKLKDVETRQQILELERRQAESEATQATQISAVNAEQKRASQEAVIVQERQVELARIEKEKQVQEMEIARQQAVEIARTQQEQAVQAAQIVRDQHVQMANVERDKGVSLAERLKEIAIAEQETARAKAEEGAFLASADREKASQQVTTVVQLAEADREANKKLIAARQEIEQQKLRQQTTADVDAYSRVKLAESEKEAAQKQSDARLQLATADAQAKEMVARGEKAQQLVAVEVAREQVQVEEAKVAVERQQLENRQEFAEAGIQLEVRKLSIQADRDVQIEFARALASFMENGRMTLYGTPETATTMLDNMAKGFGLRSTIEGFLGGPNGGLSQDNTDTVGLLLNQVGNYIKPMLTKATGATMDSEQMQKVVASLAANPAVLMALKEAVMSSTPNPSKSDNGAAPAEKVVVPAKD